MAARGPPHRIGADQNGDSKMFVEFAEGADPFIFKVI
jgi:hypothetical protein